MAKSYFAILGVSSDASHEEIRSAFRRLAKEFHPDHFEGGSETFRQIQEAYAVLKDTRRRQEYEARLKLGVRPRQTPQAGRQQPEPLIPRQRPEAAGEATPLGPRRPRRSMFEDIFQPLRDADQPMAPTWRRHGEDLTVAVPLTRAQAARGGSVAVTVPARAECPACRGAGGSAFFPCRRCGGTGEILMATPIRIPFPPGLVQDYTVSVSLGRLGMGNGRLTVFFRV
jgi:DnaJ-class molecular chaperone